jgi:hypothetical protein
MIAVTSAVLCVTAPPAPKQACQCLAPLKTMPLLRVNGSAHVARAAIAMTTQDPYCVSAVVHQLGEREAAAALQPARFQVSCLSSART